MLALLRVIFGFALFSVFAKATRLAGTNPQTEGTTDAGYVALTVIIGIANAVVWAPLVGRLVADPLTGAFTSGNPADFSNDLLQFAHKLALRRWRKLALFFAFLEGVRHPDLPGAFVLGMNHARPGSLLERIFAGEVWRFDNAENCLRAWRILQRRGVEPGLHPRSEVNLLIHSQQRITPPPTTILPVPPAPPAPAPQRNERIQLFKGAPGAASPAASPPMPPEPAASPLPPIEPTPESAPALESPPPSLPPATPRTLTLRERLRVLFTGR